MAENQLMKRGINSPTVLNAMVNVPRHLFVPESLRYAAYDDSPLPIGCGQTISQPYIVAYMTQMINPHPGMRVLEIGTGSGYQAAVLSHIGCEVYSIESVEALHESAKKVFESLGMKNIYLKLGNGYGGWPEEAPFDAVIVTAAPENTPRELISQLKDGGRMIIPVGGAHEVQTLKMIEKKNGAVIESDLMAVRFVPMVFM